MMTQPGKERKVLIMLWKAKRIVGAKNEIETGKERKVLIMCKKETKLNLAILLMAAALCMAGVACGDPMGTAFTYQGRLTDANSPAEGLYDFEFAVYNALDGGGQQGSTVSKDDVDVIDSYFTAELDFGSSVFTGDARWLQVTVRPGASIDPCDFATLNPRQELTPAPYAMHSENADKLDSFDSSAFAAAAHSHGGVYALISHTHSGSDITTGTVADARIASSIARDSELTWGNLANIPAGFADGVDNDSGGDITSVSAGTGLSGGGSSGGVMLNVSVPLSLSGSVFGGIISGTNSDGGGMGIRGHNTGHFGLGVSGKATGSGGRGVYGYATGSGGTGVYGKALGATTVTNYGGFFEVSGSSGRGVYGIASSTGEGTNYGGYFEAGGTTGMGVRGKAGRYGNYTNYGGYFEAAGSTGRGVYGLATGSSGRGVYGEATSSSGRGVHGNASGSSGRGVHGYASGESGMGVYGYASGSSAQGVRGYGGDYDFYASGPGTNYGSSSSIRWKRDVQPIDDPLGKVLRLRGVYFNWDAEHGGHYDVGMIAEEVGEVLPEIVGYEKNGIDASGMDYGMLAPLLVEAVKALKMEVDEQQKQLTEKDVQIAELKDRLSTLETMMVKLTRWQEGGI